MIDAVRQHADEPLDWNEWLDLEIGRRAMVRPGVEVNIDFERELDYIGEGIPCHLSQIGLRGFLRAQSKRHETYADC